MDDIFLQANNLEDSITLVPSTNVSRMFLIVTSIGTKVILFCIVLLPIVFPVCTGASQ